MTRREMIEVLIQDRLNDWVFASNYDDFVDISARRLIEQKRNK